MAQTSAEKLGAYLACRKGKTGLSAREREQLARTPEPPLPKGTESSVQSTRSLGGRESRWARAPPWRERGRIRAGAWRGKGGLHRERRQIPRRKGRACKNRLPRSRRKHERMSGRKSSSESCFHSKSGQT